MFADLKVPLVFCAALCALLLMGASACAQDTPAMATAKAFLSDSNRAKGTLFFCHPTATYRGVRVLGQGGVKQAGLAVPGAFYIEVRYTWKSLFDDTNTSDLVFFFDARGRLTDLRAGRTTSIFPQFAASNAVIDAVKTELMKEVARWKDATARQTALNLIDRADARGLLLLILQQAQP
jgi:hypothetical protein